MVLGLHYIVKKIGDGNFVEFWADNWLGVEAVLKTRYARLFSLSPQQNFRVH